MYILYIYVLIYVAGIAAVCLSLVNAQASP